METKPASDAEGTRNARVLVSIFRSIGFDLPPGRYSIRRTRAGRHQRSAGAWSWWLDSSDIGNPPGSAYPVSEVVSAAKDGRVVLYTNEFTGSTEILVSRT